jgi:hypothetical protein
VFNVCVDVVTNDEFIIGNPADAEYGVAIPELLESVDK